MKWFQEQFAQSNIISGVIALALVGVICYLAVTGQTIPEVVSGGFLSVIAFFFGSKMGQQDGYARALRAMKQDNTEV
jgi:hypothetical protein